MAAAAVKSKRTKCFKTSTRYEHVPHSNTKLLLQIYLRVQSYMMSSSIFASYRINDNILGFKYLLPSNIYGLVFLLVKVFYSCQDFGFVIFYNSLLLHQVIILVR